MVLTREGAFSGTDYRDTMDKIEPSERATGYVLRIMPITDLLALGWFILLYEQGASDAPSAIYSS